MPERVPYEPGHIYFITKNIKRRQKIFVDESCVKQLLDEFNFYRDKFGFLIYAWVIMLDHFHWIIEPNPDDYSKFQAEQTARNGKYHKDPQKYYLSARMESLNSHAAQKINILRDNVGVTLWQKGFYDRVIRDRDVMETAVSYIHYNPVKVGYCDHPTDYPWSSYHAMFHNDHSLLRLDPIPF